MTLRELLEVADDYIEFEIDEGPDSFSTVHGIPDYLLKLPAAILDRKVATFEVEVFTTDSYIVIVHLLTEEGI